jgi:pentatricopeptide repeat protein
MQILGEAVINAAFASFEVSQEPNIVIRSRMILACGRFGKTSTARKLFQFMKRDGLEPYVILVAYSSLIAAFDQRDESDAIFNVFHDMKKVGVVPDIIAYTQCVPACAQSGRIDEALLLHKEMKETVHFADRLRTNSAESVINLYNPLLLACQKAGRHEEAFMLFEEMSTLGISSMDERILCAAVEWVHHYCRTISCRN